MLFGGLFGIAFIECVFHGYFPSSFLVVSNGVDLVLIPRSGGLRADATQLGQLSKEPTTKFFIVASMQA